MVKLQQMSNEVTELIVVFFQKLMLSMILK
jgi:hypothetical protein